MKKIDDKTITIVCVYNDNIVFNNNLLKSIQMLTDNIDTIFIDNSNHKYVSMASAYNDAIQKTNTEWALFAHQDIEFEENFVSDVIGKINELPNVGLVGVAGCKQDDSEVYSNIKYGPRLVPAGTQNVDLPIKVQTLDECLLIGRTEVLKEHPFDEQVCQGWHLYGVDLCLELSKFGYSNYVIDSVLNHNSKAVSMNSGYFDTLFLLYGKYKDQFSNIHTTCGNWIMTQKRQIYRLWIKEKVKEILGFHKGA